MSVVTQPARRWSRWARWLLVIPVVFLLILLFGSIVFVPLQIAWTLLFGWLRFGAAALAAATPNWALVAEAAICLAAVALGTHWFLAWLYRGSGSGEPRVWPMRWTGAGLSMVMLLFVVGISVTGITHQTVWLLSSDKRWLQSNWDGIYVEIEARQLGEPYMLAVADLFAGSARWPSSTQEAFGKPVILLDGRYVQSLTVQPGGRIVFKLNPSFTNVETFEFYPEVLSDQSLRWRCPRVFERLRCAAIE